MLTYFKQTQVSALVNQFTKENFSSFEKKGSIRESDYYTILPLKGSRVYLRVNVH